MPFEQRPRKRSHVSEAIAAAATRRLVGDLPPFPIRPQPGGPTGHVVLTAEVPSPPLSINATQGRGYKGHQAVKKQWQALGRQMATDGLAVLEPYRGHRLRVTLALPVARPGACDVGNYVGGVTVKAWQDGFTRSGVVLPDDTQTWLDTQVVFWRGGAEGSELRVKVEVAPPPPSPREW